MVKSGKLNVIDGGKPNDIVTVKCLTKAGVLAGRCDLDTFTNVRDCLEDQGFLDLVDSEGAHLRVFGEHVIALVHVETAKKASPLILPK